MSAPDKALLRLCGINGITIENYGETAMGIGFIGAGKVASSFGRYLHGLGVDIGGYYDRNRDKTILAADSTESAAFMDAASLAANCDIIFITTRDDQITGACEALCSGGAVMKHHSIGHMSGAHSSEILVSARDLGASVFSLHPLQAFADGKKAMKELPDTYFSLEGEDAALIKMERMLKQIGNPYFKIKAEHKSLYHLSAVIFSNYLITLIDSGLDALENSGIDRINGFAAMKPLIMGTIANIAAMGTEKALTGPIARGDSGTIETHLTALDELNLTELKSFYKYMGTKTIALAEKSALHAPEKAAALRRLME